MSDPVARLLGEYAEGVDAAPSEATNSVRLEQRVRSTLRKRAARRGLMVQRLTYAMAALVVLAIGGMTAAFTLGKRSAEAELVASVPAGEWLSAQQVPEVRKFNDGSSVRLEAESRARVQFVEKTGGLVHLDRGKVRLKVKHRKGSTWRVAAGPYDVEAIGTEFVVDWSSTRGKPLRVVVTEGTVAVRGPGLKGTRFVSAQQSVEVSAEPEAIASPAPAPKISAEPELEPAPELINSAARSAAAEPSWRSLEAAGKYGDAVKAAERKGLSSIYQSGSADELLALARAGRFAGRMDVAGEALRACRSRYAGSRQAAMAAFQLGRAASGASAAEWFSTYLREEPRGALAREALGRLIEAHTAAGAHGAASAAAERYLNAYPDGPHATLARQALGR